MMWVRKLVRPRHEVGPSFIFSKRPLFQSGLFVLPTMIEPSGVVVTPVSVQQQLRTSFLCTGWVWSRRVAFNTADTNRFFFVDLLDLKQSCCVETAAPKTRDCRPAAFPSWILLLFYNIRNISIVLYFRQIRFKENNIQEDCQYSGSKMQSPN